MGPGGRLQRGVLSLRTSEFWRPVLGDLEAKNLDSLEDYSLVAKNVLSTAWWPHKGAGGYCGFIPWFYSELYAGRHVADVPGRPLRAESVAAGCPLF